MKRKMESGTHTAAPDDVRPVPDPTALTDMAIARASERFERELRAQKELFQCDVAAMKCEVAAVKEFFLSRIGAMDRATELLAENVHRVPTDTTSQVANLRDFVTMRFQERDLRTNQWQTDTKEAVGNARNSADRALIEAKDSQSRALVETKDSMNKRCENIETQQRGFDERVRGLMPRTESEALHRTAHERNEQLAAQVASLVGRLDLRDERGKGLHQGWVAMVAGVSFLATVAGIVMMILSRVGS